ncbi:hypothetical protein EPN18_10105 [bacterium]|nr:MAG: hypothetical protein EPN18_10105 [bacterium]
MPRHDYRIQRGRILKVLYKPYPEGLSDRVISLTLNDIRMAASAGVIKGHVSYLAERRLVAVENVQDMELEIDYTARLTAAGVDFVEKDASDDGIDMGV